ncbi:ankyrin repeat domain-containing protein [Dactylosporangium matsuzakiense]|uniref:ankyrin repeat domain-containing protein n=1 Tax=Dactylosporangium matsuzakiense TaxID=53360 RepID=UPI0021C38613|nr:ankyrin repeat domain-containing protein [Dactylosporangium matsuzakiense]UWZ45250.1 hypothetical protein Dmats_01460 [Dactylosporangium matsuzakiense]
MRWRPLPPRMVERATACREAGDWPAAWTAAGGSAEVNLKTIGRVHGPDIAGRVEEDLLHLAPDLLRWHLVRRGPEGRMRPGLGFPLALYPGGHALLVRTPDGPDLPQRMLLQFARLDRIYLRRRDDVMLLLRDHWDVRCTSEKLARSGGRTRLPFFTAAGDRLPEDALGAHGPEGAVERAVQLDDAGRHSAAWAAAGYALSAPKSRFFKAFRPIHTTLDDSVDRALAYIASRRDNAAPPPPPNRRERRAIATGRAPRSVPDPLSSVDVRCGRVRIDLRGRTLILSARAAHLVTPGDEHDLPRIPSLPVAVANRPPELAALLRGDVLPAELHPLAYAALFPAAAPRPPAPSASVPLRESIEVSCSYTTHAIQVRDGFVLPHSGDEIQRERTLAALGGRLHGCVAAVEAWRDPSIRRPGSIRALRAAFVRYFTDADTAAVEAALDRGLDPSFRDARGRTLLHLLPWLPDLDLLPRLMALGLDLQAYDLDGRTPLHVAVDHGSAELIRALVRAGADPEARARPNHEHGLTRQAIPPWHPQASLINWYRAGL